MLHWGTIWRHHSIVYSTDRSASSGRSPLEAELEAAGCDRSRCGRTWGALPTRNGTQDVLTMRINAVGATALRRMGVLTIVVEAVCRHCIGHIALVFKRMYSLSLDSTFCTRAALQRLIIHGIGVSATFERADRNGTCDRRRLHFACTTRCPLC